MIGKRIKEARERAGMSQTELATKTGVAQTTISKIERGEMDDSPNAASVRKVLAVFDGAAPPAPQTPTQKAPADAELAAERTIGEAIVPGRDLPRDATAVAREVAHMLVLARGNLDEQRAAARVWLDAAADLRAEGIPVTAQSLLVQSTLTLLRAKTR